LKIDAFLFLQRSDIAHYAATQPELGDVPHLFVDAGLVEEAVKAGLDQRRFSYRPLDVGAHFHARVTHEANTRAAVIDQCLTRERQRLFGRGVLQGWDQGALRLFFMRAMVAKYLGQACHAAFAEPLIGLFRPSRPQLFYFDSGLTTDLFTASADRWRIVDHCDTVQNWVPEPAGHAFDFSQVAQLAGAAQRSGQPFALTHIPTCYQHHARFVAEITDRFRINIDLPSAFWDIPVRRSTSLAVRLVDLPPDHVSERALRYRERARRVLEEQLAPLIPNHAALHAQVDLLAERCFMQALNFEGLSAALRGTRPHFVLADHDTGNNGPLFSVAAELGAPITVLPHSAYPIMTLPHALNVRAVERHGFQTPTQSVWGEPITTAGVQLTPRVTPVARQRVGSVCLLLNTLYSQGLSHIDFAGMTRFHRALAALCQQHGARLSVRLKPNGAAVMMAASAFEMSPELLLDRLRLPIEQVAEQTDLCIAYGEPTTAMIEFISRGSHLLHSSEQTWPSDYWAAPALLADGTVVSRHDAATLAEVAELLADDTLFRQRAQAQQQRFVQRLARADQALFAPAPPAAAESS
jgi:hypothetical protein